MSAAICLVLYSFAVAVIGPPLLTRLTRAGVAPRLGVAAWLAAIGSVLAAWTLAAAFLVGELVRDWHQPGRAVLSACIAVLRESVLGRYGGLLQAGLFVLAACAATAVAVLAGRLGQSLLRVRASSREHAWTARLVGRRLAGGQVVVLDAAERIAYCVPGRPSAIVVTSAALDALSERHLNAVLCHERAHLTGHHHLILALTRDLATILPRSELQPESHKSRS